MQKKRMCQNRHTLFLALFGDFEGDVFVVEGGVDIVGDAGAFLTVGTYALVCPLRLNEMCFHPILLRSYREM